MTPRRILPGPFWTMLAAVWALVLLGATPDIRRDPDCGTPRHPAHHVDCVACCPCTVTHAVQAVMADAPSLPLPSGGALGRSAAASRRPSAGATQPTARARGPPATA